MIIYIVNAPIYDEKTKREGSTEGQFNGYYSYRGRRGHSKDQCWIRHRESRNKKKDKQGTGVETEIIVSTIKVIKCQELDDSKEETFEVENVAQMELPDKVIEAKAENLTQMEFLEAKINK